MEVLTEIAAEVLTEVDLVVVLALILNIVAVICKDSKIGRASCRERVCYAV